MAGYTRQSSLSDGDIISASLFNNEYNQLLAAFNNSTGHKHDGTASEGPVIALIGDAGLQTPLNKVTIDTSNNEIEFSIDVSSVSIEQFKIIDGAIVPTTDNDIDLGTSSLEFKDAYFDGTVNLDSLVIGSATAITDVDTDLNSVSASDDTLASAKAIKTYVDAQVTVQDLDFIGDTGGAQSIDLDSQTLTIAGGTGISSVGSAQTITLNIDSTVATLTGSQTLTNKILTSPVLNGTLSGTAFLDEDTMSSDSATAVASQQSIKAYVDAQVATANELSELTDVNITSPADASLLFYDTGTSKWIDNVVSGDITIADTGVAAIGSGVIVNDDVNASAAIVYSKLSLTDSILNADINSAAAIVDTKLDTISTANKVSLSALDIDGATDIGAALAGTDLIAVDDGAGGTNRKSAVSRIATYVESTISGDITISGGTAAIGSGVIVNADINASAAIDATKIHDGSVSNTEFGYLNGVTSAIQTQMDTKASSGFAVAMAIAL